MNVESSFTPVFLVLLSAFVVIRSMSIFRNLIS